LNKNSDLIILKVGKMKSNSRVAATKTEAYEAVLKHCHERLACFGGDAGDCLVTSSMRTYLKRSLSMASLRDNQCAGPAFTFILFLLQIHH